jgi:hypothetical protein
MKVERLKKMKFCRERLRERLGGFCRWRGCVRGWVSFAAGCAVTRERERVFFFNIIDASDCYSGALYIRLYYSILMFRESVMGHFL